MTCTDCPYKTRKRKTMSNQNGTKTLIGAGLIPSIPITAENFEKFARIDLKTLRVGQLICNCKTLETHNIPTRIVRITAGSQGLLRGYALGRRGYREGHGLLSQEHHSDELHERSGASAAVLWQAIPR